MQVKHIILIIAVVIALIVGPIVALVILFETSKDNGDNSAPIVTLQLSRNGTVLGTVQGTAGFVYNGEMYVLMPAVAPAVVSQIHKYTPSNLSSPTVTWGINGIVTDFIIQQGLLYYVQAGSIFTVNLPPTSNVTLSGNLWRRNQSVLITDPLNNNLYQQRQTFAAPYPYDATRRNLTTYQAATAIDGNGTLSFVTTNERTIFSVQHNANTWTMWSIVWVNLTQAQAGQR